MNTKINIPSGTNLNKISLDDLSERIKTDISSEPIIEKKLSLMEKEISVDKTLNDILNKAFPVDFQIEIFGDEVSILHNLISNSVDSKSSALYEHKLQKLKVKEEQKYVVIINKFFEIATSMGYSFCFSNDKIYWFNLQYWKEKDHTLMTGFLSYFSEKLGVSRFDAHQFKVSESLYKQFIAQAARPKSTDSISTEIIAINMKNGTFTFNQGKSELREFREEDFLKYQLPFSYDPNATAPMFIKFLNHVLPDENLQNILFEFLGYPFLKHLKLEKILFLLGDGSNGKSVIGDIVQSLFGKKNVSGYSLLGICDTNSYTRANLNDILLNYSTEVGSGKLNIDNFKIISSGEPIEARKLYKDAYMIENYCRFMFNCNSLPKQVENNNAFIRRFIIIPFDVTISDKDKDINLAKKIISSELPGIFNLVLLGIKRLQEQGDFTKSEIVNNMREKYQNESNPILTFLMEENYKISYSNKLPIEEFYQKYKNYAVTNGFHPFNKNNFNSQLRKRGFKIEKSTGGYYYIWCEKEIILVDEIIQANQSEILKKILEN